MLTWEKQTKTYSHMKLWDNITPQILNRFQWLKAHNDQDKEIYALHTMILEKRGFEILLIFEAEGKTVLFWSSWPETDDAKAFQWWLVKVVWFRNPCGGLKLGLSWVMCEEKQPWEMAFQLENVDGNQFKMLCRCSIKQGQAQFFESFWLLFEKWPKMRFFREWVFFLESMKFCWFVVVLVAASSV